MAFPSVLDRDQGNSGNATSHPANLGTHATGNYLVVVWAFDGNPTLSVNTGVSGSNWEFDQVSHSSGTPKFAIARKVAESASEALTLTSSSEASAHMSWVFDSMADATLYFTTDATISGSNPDCPNLAPVAGTQDYLWIAGFSRDNQATASAGPGSYTEFRTEPGVSSGGAAMAVAERELNASSENPGAFTVGVEQYITFTIAIYDDTSGGVDATPPTMNGAITVSAYTEGGGAYSVDWPAASDNVAVTGYEISLNDGSSWADLGDVLTYDATGRTPGTTDQIRVRAYDAAANVAATPLALDLIVGGRYISALSFKSNGTTDSDVKFWFDDDTSDMPPQKTTLCIKWSKRRQQTGFYAEWWRMPNISATYGDIVGDTYAGFHPYPCDGTVDTDGTPLGTTGVGVSTHYAEVAGLPNRDIIGDASLESHASVKGEWVADANYTEVNGSNIRHRYYPDLFGDPTFFITVDIAESAYDAETVNTDPHLMFGAPTWTVSGSTNDETPAGEHRGIRIFDTSASGTFSLTEMQDEATAAWESTNAPATAKGITGVWYINDDPTPSDITDKSGEGHDPDWGNARRPDAYEEIVESVAGPTTYTLTASLSMAVQQARAATAGMSVAVQTERNATTSLDAVLQAARTAQTDLSAAVLQARAASTLVDLAVQTVASISASASLVVQEERAAQSDVSLAVLEPRTSTASVGVAVQDTYEASTAVDLAVQEARTAAASLSLAVQRAQAATASVDLQVQAASQASADVSLMVQAGSSASLGLQVLVQEARAAATQVALAVQQVRAASIAVSVAVRASRASSTSLNVAVLQARVATAQVAVAVQAEQVTSTSLDAAVAAPGAATTDLGLVVQEGRTATASVDLQVQGAATALVALDAAVQFARLASTSVGAAVAATASASVSLAAAVSVRRTLGAAMDAAVRSTRLAGCSVSLYIQDGDTPSTPSLQRTYRVRAENRTLRVRAENRTLRVQ